MIPDELKALHQWVVVRNDSKVPINAVTGNAASASDPSTWSSYETAQDVVDKNPCYLLGFVFHDNGIVGIDLDKGYEDGFIVPDIARMIKDIGSYTEKSRSGRGFHILVRGTLPFKGRNNHDGVEIYKDGRYFIMTGNRVYGEKITDNQAAIDRVIAERFPEIRAGREGVQQPKIYEPQWPRPTGGKIKLRPIYPAIPAGCRNICLTSLGGLMHRTGYPPEAIYQELCYANETACQPTLDLSEVEAITRSVTRYKR